MLKRNVQNLNKEYLLICIVKVGVHVPALNSLSQRFESLLFSAEGKLLLQALQLLGDNCKRKKLAWERYSQFSGTQENQPTRLCESPACGLGVFKSLPNNGVCNSLVVSVWHCTQPGWHRSVSDCSASTVVDNTCRCGTALRGASSGVCKQHCSVLMCCINPDVTAVPKIITFSWVMVLNQCAACAILESLILLFIAMITDASELQCCSSSLPSALTRQAESSSV